MKKKTSKRKRVQGPQWGFAQRVLNGETVVTIHVPLVFRPSVVIDSHGPQALKHIGEFLRGAMAGMKLGENL